MNADGMVSGDVGKVKALKRVQFTVLGVAQPKGSARAFMRPGMKFPVVTSDNKSVKGWEDSVRAALQTHAGTFFDGAVAVRVVFELPRPKSMSKNVTQHTKRPDCDKLVRSTLDAMIGVLFADDSQVVEIMASKRYATVQPQARVEVEERIW